MEFRFHQFDQLQHNQVFRTPSSSSYSSYNFFSSQVPEVLQRSMDIRESINRELEKERIRSEIIAGEIERQRVLEEEVIRREMVIERGGFQLMLRQQYLPEIMHGECFAPENIMSSFSVRYSGPYGGEIQGFEAVPFQQPPSPKFKEIVNFQPPKDSKKDIIGLGNPFVTSGSKRKSSPSPAGSGSTGLCSNSSKKKIKEEFSCAACEISATCERGLNEHIAGKKHQAKMKELISNKKSAHIGLGKVTKKQPLEIKNCSDSDLLISKEDNKTEGCDKKITSRKKLKIWCHVCKIGVDDEKNMSSHRKGKKHLKNRLKKEREKTKRARSRSN